MNKKSNIQIKITCPRCDLIVRAKMESVRDFVIYQCPGCKNNIALLDSKVMVISEVLFKKLINLGLFETCGNLTVKKPLKATLQNNPQPQNNVQGISKDDIVNLKILLETESDFKKILSQL